jgi:hypothetical protein
MKGDLTAFQKAKLLRIDLLPQVKGIVQEKGYQQQRSLTWTNLLIFGRSQDLRASEAKVGTRTHSWSAGFFGPRTSGKTLPRRGAPAVKFRVKREYEKQIDAEEFWWTKVEDAVLAGYRLKGN